MMEVSVWLVTVDSNCMHGMLLFPAPPSPSLLLFSQILLLAIPPPLLLKREDGCGMSNEEIQKWHGNYIKLMDGGYNTQMLNNWTTTVWTCGIYC